MPGCIPPVMFKAGGISRGVNFSAAGGPKVSETSPGPFRQRRSRSVTGSIPRGRRNVNLPPASGREKIVPMDPLLEAALRRKELEDLLKEDPAARTRRQFRQYLEDTNTAPGYFGEPRDSWRRRGGARHAIFRQYDQAERYAKLAETSGVLDLLTLHPGLKAAQALKAKSFIPAGANALAFASQFGDDMLSRALGDASVALPLLAGARGLSSSARAVRGLEELAANAGMTSVGNFAARRMGMDVGGPGTDEKAAIPVYEGVTTTGKLRQMAKRAAEKGKDLPQFNWEGKIAPARQRKLEKDMRAWIPMLGSKDPEGQVKLLDAWVKNNPFWGKYPLEKGPLLDLMPAKLRPAMNFALMNSGYGGINMGARTALGSRGEKLGTRARNDKFSEITPFSERKFEEIMPYYMSGNLPAGWAAANPGRQPSWVARPGEKLAPGQRNILDEYVKSAGGGGTAAALGAGIAGGMTGLSDEPSEDDLAAVPGRKKLLRRLAMAQNPRFLEPQSNLKVPGSAAAVPRVWGAQRYENLADILPGRQQRRGLFYTLAEPRPVNQLGKPGSAYEDNFGDLLSPASEGGSRGILGDAVVRNPLLIPSTSFFGWEADKFMGPKPAGWPIRRKTFGETKSWEELNKTLPKKYRLNNTDIRNFKSDPNRKYEFRDAVGDLLLSKYMKAEGYDAGIPRVTRDAINRKGARNIHQAEVIFPSESRWDLRPQFQPNWRTLETWAKGQKALPPEVELSLLKRGVKPASSEISDLDKASYIIEKAGLSITPDQYLKSFKTTGTPFSFLSDQYNSIVKTYGPPKIGSKLDSFAKQLGVEIPQGKKKDLFSTPPTSSYDADWDDVPIQQSFDALDAATKPKMTKADRIAKWGNPGLKTDEGKILFEPEDFFKYRLPNNSVVGKKLSAGTIIQDYSSPVAQELGESGGFGGPKFYGSFTDPATALELAKKGAKPLSGNYTPKKSKITEEQINELKKFFNVIPVD